MDNLSRRATRGQGWPVVSRSFVAVLAALVVAGCGQGKSESTAKQAAVPKSDAEIIALKTPGTNAVIVHVMGYGTADVVIAGQSQTCVGLPEWEYVQHYSKVCWAYVPVATASVTVSATPNGSSVFRGWNVPTCTTADNCEVAMNTDRTVNVGFDPSGGGPAKSIYRLSVHVMGFVDGDISASPGVDLACQPGFRTAFARTCEALVPAATPATQVTLTATPRAGTGFSGWGGQCSGTGACTLTVDRDVGVTAGFAMLGSGGGGGTGGGSGGGASVAGSWGGAWWFTNCGPGPACTIGQHVNDVQLILSQNGTAVTGTFLSDQQTQLSGTFSNGTFTFRVDYPGQSGYYEMCTATVTGTTQGSTMHGDCTQLAGGYGTFSFDAVLGAAASGGGGGGTPPVISSFTASPAVIQDGQVAMLYWVVDGATTMSLTPGVGAVVNSTEYVSPTTTTTYTLTASGAGGTVSATATVTVLPAWHVTTVAGTQDLVGSIDAAAGGARFNNPMGVAADSVGNLYVADTQNSTIRKISPSGTVSTLAGTPGGAGFADGVGNAARFNQPYAIAVDFQGNVYVADTYNYVVRKITPAGVVSTLAGRPGMPGSIDGAAGAALFQGLYGIAVDGAGTVYVTDAWNNTVRSISPGGAVSTIAGSVGVAGSADGVGPAARFAFPWGIAVDGSGNVYVADSGNNTIRKITSGRAVSTIAGTAGLNGSEDGIGPSARFLRSKGLAADLAGNVYVAEEPYSTIRQIFPDGTVLTVAGQAGVRGFVDGNGPLARFSDPMGVAVDGAGNVFVADTYNAMIRRLTPPGRTVPVQYHLGGRIAGLVGEGLKLVATSESYVSVAAGGTSFAFGGTLASGTPYSVTIAQQPNAPAQVCVVANGSGVVGAGDVTDVAVTCTNAVAGTPGTFRSTGNMVIARRDAAASLLPSGKVLVTGGVDSAYRTLAAAETFNPVSRTFAAEGSMVTPRSEHASITLSSGKVLIVGGYGADGSALASAEVYDPTTRIFTPTGGMAVARRQPFVASLPGGRVLVAGGTTTQGDTHVTAEIYDPSAGSFSATGSMVDGHANGFCVTLADGRPLLGAGIFMQGGGGHSVGSTEVFDPSTGTFTKHGPFTEPNFLSRQYATANVLPNGKILVAGGISGSGGILLGRPETSLAVDPTNGRFVSAGTVRIPRQAATSASLLDGRVLIIGGFAGGGTNGWTNEALPGAEIYDPATGTFAATGSLSTPRFRPTVTALNDGSVLVAGGDGIGGVKATAETYAP